MTSPNREAAQRLQLSVKTQKHIWGLFAGRCAMCKIFLVHSEESANALLGEVAHIIGDKTGAARGRHPATDTVRSHPDNLMLLCQADHKIIDDNPELYPIDRLRMIRRDYLSWLAHQLTPNVAWATMISQYLYLNVPRLDEFSMLSGLRIERPAETDIKALHRAGHSIAEFMDSYRRALEQATIAAVDLTSIAFVHEAYVGQIVSIDHQSFESEGLPFDRDDYFGAPDWASSGRRPKLTWTNGDVSVVLMIDSRWITTNTGYLIFTPSSGMALLSGYARITSVDYATLSMTATALALGVPVSGNEQAALASARLSRPAAVDLSRYEDDASKARDQIWDDDPPINCDICKSEMSEDRFMIDGSLKGSGDWKIMCSACFSRHGTGIGIGQGQLYRHERRGWLLVGGMPEPLY